VVNACLTFATLALATAQNRDSVAKGKKKCNTSSVGRFLHDFITVRFGERSHFMLKHLSLTALFFAGFATIAFAGPADDLIKERQTCMKAQGAAMGVFVPVMKGEKPFDAVAHKAAFDSMGAACVNWTKFFAPETAKGETVETWAKPEIWSDPKAFEAVSGKAYAAGEALKVVTDEAGFKAAFPAFGAGCQGCHEISRRPKG
jgi:cytochrome c556